MNREKKKPGPGGILKITAVILVIALVIFTGVKVINYLDNNVLVTSAEFPDDDIESGEVTKVNNRIALTGLLR